jgi:hypothetical protein
MRGVFYAVRAWAAKRAALLFLKKKKQKDFYDLWTAPVLPARAKVVKIFA